MKNSAFITTLILVGIFFLLFGIIAVIGILGSLGLIALPTFAIAIIASMGLAIPPVAGFIILAGLAFTIGLTFLIIPMTLRNTLHKTMITDASPADHSTNALYQITNCMVSEAGTNIEEERLVFVILGFNGIGKTSLLKRIENNSYDEVDKKTYAAEFVSTVLDFAPNITLQLWTISQSSDTRTHREYISYIESNPQHYSAISTKVIILAFSLTDRTSFDDLQELKSVIQKKAPTAKFILVGLKSDEVENNRRVQVQEAQTWAQENKCIGYMEVSSKTGENVDVLFAQLIKVHHSQLANKL